MKTVTKMTGFKATDANMVCRGFQFRLGEWFEHKGDLEMCKQGFHFCVHPSGVWSFYNDPGTRVFAVEAEEILETPYEAGAELKKVARRIRFLREIAFEGNSNTGDRNTGYSNTGDRNTGDRNTGYSNTGDSNTGDSNTGDSNTGDSNTGDSNTGDSNTGDSNTGYSNTGNRNTGNSNTGDSNTGNSNTGYGCATNRSPDFFSINQPKVKSFGVQTKLTADEFMQKYPLYFDLCVALHETAPIDIAQFKTIPGITKRKLAQLHKKHLAAKSK